MILQILLIKSITLFHFKLNAKFHVCHIHASMNLSVIILSQICLYCPNKIKILQIYQDSFTFLEDMCQDAFLR